MNDEGRCLARPAPTVRRLREGERGEIPEAGREHAAGTLEAEGRSRMSVVRSRMNDERKRIAGWAGRQASGGRGAGGNCRAHPRRADGLGFSCRRSSAAASTAGPWCVPAPHRSVDYAERPTTCGGARRGARARRRGGRCRRRRRDFAPHLNWTAPEISPSASHVVFIGEVAGGEAVPTASKTDSCTGSGRDAFAAREAGRSSSTAAVGHAAVAARAHTRGQLMLGRHRGAVDFTPRFHFVDGDARCRVAKMWVRRSAADDEVRAIALPAHAAGRTSGLTSVLRRAIRLLSQINVAYPVD